MQKLGLLLSILITASAFSAHAGSVYKWTDENGVTHFGDRQPAGKQSESVNVRSGTTSNNKSSSSSKTPQEQAEELNRSEQQQSEASRERRAEEARAKQLEKNCEIARDNLKTMKTYSRIKIEENGEQRYLTPEEIQAKREEYEAIAQDSCGNNLHQGGVQ